MFFSGAMGIFDWPSLKETFTLWALPNKILCTTLPFALVIRLKSEKLGKALGVKMYYNCK
jgi:hypothetical protein